MEKLKKLIGIGVPGGLDDILVRALKTGIAVLLGSAAIIALPTGQVDIDALGAAVLAAGSAAASVVINAILLALAKFANS